MDNISPEERLFRAIDRRNSDERRSPGVLPSTGKKDERKFHLKPPLVVMNLKKDIGRYLQKTYFAVSKGSFADINMQAVNKILMGVAGILTVFLIGDFIRMAPRINKVYEDVSVLPAAHLKKKNISPLEPVSVYFNVAAKRDVFNPVLPKAAVPVASVKAVPLSELTKDLRLVGIYWGEAPEAMLEDTSEKKTYFLKIGQTIKGIKVNSILEDRIILEYGDETMEFM